MTENNIINIIKKDNTLIVEKKIVIPFDETTLQCQHDFIKYLSNNNIKVAKILSLRKNEKYFFEDQEFIQNSTSDIDIKELISVIAIFHKVSKQYTNDILKESVYNFKFDCNGIQLEHLLLGFEEKYYHFPKQELKKKRVDIKKEQRLKIDD